MRIETRPISLLPGTPSVPVQPKESRELYRKLAESKRTAREWRKRYDDLLASNEMTTPLEFLPPDGVRLIRVVVRRIDEPDILPLLPESDDIT